MKGLHFLVFAHIPFERINFIWVNMSILHSGCCTSHSQMLGKVESGGGPIFKVVLECQKRCSEPFLIYIYGIQCDFMPKSC